MPKVSVIVPVYNAEKYINRCLDSIVSQSFVDYECVLIDDGSQDLSGDICEEYVAKDIRFKTIHTVNKGVSSARQAGLNAAVGEYVIYVDPDDWIESNMLEELYNYATKTSTDYVICDFWEDRTESDREYHMQKPSSLEHSTVLMNLFLTIHGSCCNKFIKKEVIDNSNISFNPELSLCEDLLFNAMLLKNNIAIGYINKAFYHYVQYINPQSLVRKYSKEMFEHDRRMFEIFDNEFSSDIRIREIVNNSIGNLLVSRAYIGRTFSSIKFAELCFPYRKYVLRHNQGLIDKVVLYVSCLGFYNISESLRKCLFAIRNILKS